MELLLIIFTAAVLSAASYADLKTLEVPDWLSYGFLFAALGIRTIFSLQSGWEVLLEGILGFTAFFLLAHLFYYTGQWGGGDSKLLMGMGAVLGVSLPLNISSFTLLWFLLSLLFLGSIYGLAYMTVTAVKKRDLFVKEFSKRIKRAKRTNIVIVSGIFVTFILSLSISSSFLLFLSFPAMFYLFIFVNTVEKSCFIRYCKIEKLTEGDWLSEDVFIGNKKFMEKKTLQREDLIRLSSLKKEKKIDYVKVKYGVPFVPSFLIAYLAIIFVGQNFGSILRSALGY